MEPIEEKYATERIWRREPLPVSTDDGRATLTQTGHDSSRDGGGGIYTLKLEKPSHVVEPLICEALVADYTAHYAEKYYQSKNVEYAALSLVEKHPLRVKYGNQFGHHFDVKEFHPQNFVISDLSDEQMEEVRDLICALYLKRYSTYSLNNPDPDADPDGFYPDQINFQPIGPANRFKKKFSAKGVLGQ